MANLVYAGHMKHTDWFQGVAGDDSINSAAGKAGLPQGSLNRHLKANLIPAESVIRLARAYGYGVAQALVDTGYITAKEARGGVTVINWESVRDADLLRELLRRTDGDGVLPNSLWDRPLDDGAVGEIVDFVQPEPLAANRGKKDNLPDTTTGEESQLPPSEWDD